MPLLKISYREITKVGKIVRRVHSFYYEREETTTTLSCYITKFLYKPERKRARFSKSNYLRPISSKHHPV